MVFYGINLIVVKEEATKIAEGKKKRKRKDERQQY